MGRWDNTWDVLQEALHEIKYERDAPPEDRFYLMREDSVNYAVLYIFTYTKNTYHREKMRLTRHEFVVPVATYNRDTWIRWVFDCIISIEQHETAEWFFVNDERLYSPHHGNGENPYVLWYASYPHKKSKSPGDD